jgi:hypothetical protein
MFLNLKLKYSVPHGHEFKRKNEGRRDLSLNESGAMAVQHLSAGERKTRKKNMI